MELQQLPPGFRFHPTDEELVSYYLCRKCAGLPLAAPVVAEVDLYRFDPWQLPEKAAAATGGGGGGENKEKEWYFFSPRDRKYPNGSRPNRSAGTGYWKATGADKPVGSPRTLAIKKALVFYAGKPAGPRAAVKTNWIMHEYRLADVDRSAAARKRTNNNNNNALRLDDWVLCRIYNKKGVIERYDTVDDDDDGDGVKPRAAAAAAPGRTTARGNTASAAGGGGAAAAAMMKVEVPDEYGSYCYDNYDDLVGTPAAEMLCFDRPFLPPVPADHDDRRRGDSVRHATAAAADNSSCGSEHVLSPSPELPDRDHAESQPGCGAGWFDGWGGGCAEYDGFVVVDDGGALFGPPPPPLPSPALFTSRDAATLAEMLAYLQRPF